eukprot:324860_1
MTPGSILFGLILAFLAELIVAFGNIQIKYSHKLNVLSFTHTPVYKRCRWWLGFLMYLLNAIFKFSSYMFASLNILSPISSVTIIINAFLARYYFEETLTIHGIIGSISIIIGCILCIIFGEHGTDEITIKSLFKYAHTKQFITFTTLHISMCLSFGLIGLYLVFYYSSQHTNVNNAHIPDENKNVQEDEKHIASSTTSIFTTSDEKNEFFHVLTCFLLTFTTSGVCAWVQMLGKISADLLWQSVFMNNNQFTSITPFIIIIILGVLLCFELYLISEIMRLFDAVLVVPIFNSLLILTTIGVSAVYFHNFEKFSILNLVLFMFGLVLVISGMLMLMKGQKQSSMQHRHLDRTFSERSLTGNLIDIN